MLSEQFKCSNLIRQFDLHAVARFPDSQYRGLLLIAELLSRNNVHSAVRRDLRIVCAACKAYGRKLLQNAILRDFGTPCASILPLYNFG